MYRSNPYGCPLGVEGWVNLQQVYRYRKASFKILNVLWARVLAFIYPKVSSNSWQADIRYRQCNNRTHPLFIYDPVPLVIHVSTVSMYTYLGATYTVHVQDLWSGAIHLKRCNSSWQCFLHWIYWRSLNCKWQIVNSHQVPQCLHLFLNQYVISKHSFIVLFAYLSIMQHVDYYNKF